MNGTRDYRGQQQPQQQRQRPVLGRLVMLDFDDFMKASGKAGKAKARILIRLDDKFDDGNDYVEKISLIGAHQVSHLQKEQYCQM